MLSKFNLKRFVRTESLSDMALVDNEICLAESVTFTAPDVKIHRNDLISPRWEHETVLELTDEENTKVRHFKNTAWGKNEISLKTQDKEVSEKLTSKTGEDECKQIHGFFQRNNYHNHLAERIFCTKEHQQIEDALQEDGHTVVEGPSFKTW